MRFSSLFFLTAALLGVAAPLQAAIAIQSVGTPVDGNSWSQAWQLQCGDSQSNIDFISFHIGTDNTEFKHKVAVGQFGVNTTGSWCESYRSRSQATATGDWLWNTLDLRVYFEGDRDKLCGPVELIMYLYEYGKQQACQKITLEYQFGCGWTTHVETDCDRCRCHEPCGTPSTSVPEPTTLAIWSMLGGLGLIATRRRRRLA